MVCPNPIYYYPNHNYDENKFRVCYPGARLVNLRRFPYFSVTDKSLTMIKKNFPMIGSIVCKYEHSGAKCTLSSQNFITGKTIHLIHYEDFKIARDTFPKAEEFANQINDDAKRWNLDCGITIVALATAAGCAYKTYQLGIKFLQDRKNPQVSDQDKLEQIKKTAALAALTFIAFGVSCFGISNTFWA